MTNAEARFNKSLRPRKPEGSLGRTAQDVHLDSHTAPELWLNNNNNNSYIALYPVNIYKLAALYIINIKIRLTTNNNNNNKVQVL